MKKLGISLYPEKTNFDNDKAYLQYAYNLGFRRLFISLLQVILKDPEEIMERTKEVVTYAKNLGYEVYGDVNPMIFEILKIEDGDFKVFKDIGYDGLRFDMGYTGKEEALMTYNDYGLKIEINMSNDDNYLNRILDYSPYKENLMGSHNFFPQRYTGLDYDHFLKTSRKFKENYIRTAAFVTSQEASFGPWSVQEGLCTLEMHRDLKLKNQIKHLKMLDLIDDIIIGNAYASKTELEDAAVEFRKKQLDFDIHISDDVSELEKDIILDNEHVYRSDYSSYVIRSSATRFKYWNESIPPHKEIKDIEEGDILVLNDLYGQYKGEVQIALKKRNGDRKINVVGNILEEQIFLLQLLNAHQTFIFVEEKL